MSPSAGSSRDRVAGGSGARLAVWLLSLPLRLLATGLGRRLATVAVLTTLFVVVMSALYEHAERPTANALPAATSAPRPTGRAGQGPAVPRPDGPGAVAVAWYARRLGVPPGRVHALGTERPGPGRLRVLVLADLGKRQPTAWVALRRTPGGWAVAR
ncbi:MAG TPA: hypothetical protein VF486_27345 [Actinomycetes bacterium]